MQQGVYSMRSWLVILSLGLAAWPLTGAGADDPAELARLALEWRDFEQPTILQCAPDYRDSAIAAKAAASSASLIS